LGDQGFHNNFQNFFPIIPKRVICESFDWYNVCHYSKDLKMSGDKLVQRLAKLNNKKDILLLNLGNIKWN
jgi:hypothetical protein